MAHTVAKVTRLVSTFGPAVTARSVHQLKREAGFWAQSGPVKEDFALACGTQYVQAVSVLVSTNVLHTFQVFHELS